MRSKYPTWLVVSLARVSIVYVCVCLHAYVNVTHGQHWATICYL